MGAFSPLASVILCGMLLMLVAAATNGLLAASHVYAVKALAAYAVGGAGIIVCAALFLRTARFGKANFVTLGRWALTALLIGLFAEQRNVGLLWFCAVVAGVALVLDGLDGFVARRAGESTPFGARFDMETDAALMLVLCGLVWYFERAGVWIMLAGAMRYAFLAAAWVAPWMRRPLPPSMRRKTICVVQLVALVAALVPIVPPAAAVAVAATALGLLVLSFLADVLWLARNA